MVRRAIRARRHFEDAVEAYVASLNCQLDDFSMELEELRRDVEQTSGNVGAHSPVGELTTRPA